MSIADQPPPIPNERPAVWDLVIADMRERDQVGRQRYGTPLQPHNGRDALVDAYQEQLDQLAYLRQEIEERQDLRARVAGLEADLRAAVDDRDRLAADVAELEANAIEVGQRWSTAVDQLRARLAAVGAELDAADAGVAAALLRNCTCLGSCCGRDTLAPGQWCALDGREP